MLESVLSLDAVFSGDASRPVPCAAVLLTPTKRMDSHAEGLQQTRAVRPAPDARMPAAVTESLPNLKKSSPPKRGNAMESCIHETSKAIRRQKPCVVMKRADSIYPGAVAVGDGVQGVVQASVSNMRPRLNIGAR